MKGLWEAENEGENFANKAIAGTVQSWAAAAAARPLMVISIDIWRAGFRIYAAVRRMLLVVPVLEQYGAYLLNKYRGV